MSAQSSPAGRSTAGQNEIYYGLAENKLKRFLRRVNWPLLLGGVIIAFILVIAVKGPDWAPNDPMQENYALRIDENVVQPPYPPFAIPEYPLGTDQFGRGLLSRLLYGVRPTIMLVLVVASVRLFLGLLLGYFIGWSHGVSGKILDNVLSIALSIPVLIIALMGISAIGIHEGIWAFVFGLAITGWAETARTVAAQTRAVKGQAFIEASQALGASEARVFIKHVLPQISPLVWMLIAFEISATMFVVSELGFLGYYIGGGTWIEISDFQAINTAGLPELGQMLSTALVSFVKPMPLILVSSTVFLTIMGFNLVGEGLRRRIMHQTQFGYRKSLLANTRFESWLEERISPLFSDWLEENAVRLGLAAVTIVVVGGWYIWWQARPSRTPQGAQQRLTIPGGHYWPTEQHDAQGTLWVAYDGPADANVDWMFSAEGGYTGGPVVSKDGIVYISTGEKMLIALDPMGEVLWQVELIHTPVGSPGLGSEGEVYVSDAMGGLSAYDANGTFLWQYSPSGGREATSGPIVASDGTIYYTRVEDIQAVSPEGEALWQAFAYDGYFEQPPVLSAGESYIFLKDGALAASSGAKLVLDGLPLEELEFTAPAFFVGANGKTYFRSGHEVYGWWATEEGIELDPKITWDFEGQSLIPPFDQGATPDDLVWLFYTGQYFDTRFVWIDKNNNLVGNYRPPDRQSKLIALDRELTMYVCSDNFNVAVNCKAFRIDSPNPKWELEFGGQASVVGGALAPDRFYVAINTGEVGMLHAVGSGEDATLMEDRGESSGGGDLTSAATTPTLQEAPTESTVLPTVTVTQIPEAIAPSPMPDPTGKPEYLLFLPILSK